MNKKNDITFYFKMEDQKYAEARAKRIQRKKYKYLVKYFFIGMRYKIIDFIKELFYGAK